LLDGLAVANGPLAQQTFLSEAKAQFSAVAQMVGFGVGRAKMLDLSMGID
jgi:hypothetical protein